MNNESLTLALLCAASRCKQHNTCSMYMSIGAAVALSHYILCTICITNFTCFSLSWHPLKFGCHPDITNFTLAKVSISKVPWMTPCDILKYRVKFATSIFYPLGKLLTSCLHLIGDKNKDDKIWTIAVLNLQMMDEMQKFTQKPFQKPKWISPALFSFLFSSCFYCYTSHWCKALTTFTCTALNNLIKRQVFLSSANDDHLSPSLVFGG